MIMIIIIFIITIIISIVTIVVVVVIIIIIITIAIIIIIITIITITTTTTTTTIIKQPEALVEYPSWSLNLPDGSGSPLTIQGHFCSLGVLYPSFEAFLLPVNRHQNLDLNNSVK